MIRRLLNSVVKPAWNQFYVDIGGGPESCVFVAGSERSGTTWVADSINYKRDFRFLFEPFWADKVVEAGSLKPQTYIRPGSGTREQLAAAKKILSGQSRNQWTDQYHRKFVARRRLVKDVRANLFLRWLSAEFPDMPIVLLIRHPCAVAKSQIDRKHNFGNVEDTFMSQAALVEDFLEPFSDDICREHSPFEDRIFRWAIQNYVPLRQFEDNEIVVAFYENLCTRPDEEFRRVFQHIGAKYDPAVLRAAERPSPMSRAGSPVNTGEDLVASWQSSVSSSDVAAAVDILRLFKLDRIYSADPMPVTDGLRQFRSA